MSVATPEAPPAKPTAPPETEGQDHGAAPAVAEATKPARKAPPVPARPKRKPKLGDRVYYYPYAPGKQIPPAVGLVAFVSTDPKTGELTGCVNLAMIDWAGFLTPLQNVPYSEKPTMGCWSWPE